MKDFRCDIDDILLSRLSEKDLDILANFDCDDNEMNNFLRTEAFDQQELGLNNNILLYYKGNLVAFCSICADSLRLVSSEKDDENLPRTVIPAIKIARLGRHYKYKNFNFGIFLIDYVKDLAYNLSMTKLGVRFITIDAYLHRIEYYKSLGFLENEAYKKNNSTISMRADIYE